MLAEGRDLIKDYDAIRRELGRYRADLIERREIVVLNKIDVIHDERELSAVEEALRARGLQPWKISAATGAGCRPAAATTYDHTGTATACGARIIGGGVVGILRSGAVRSGQGNGDWEEK